MKAKEIFHARCPALLSGAQLSQNYTVAFRNLVARAEIVVKNYVHVSAKRVQYLVECQTVLEGVILTFN